MDIGNSHVIDWYLWLATRLCLPDRSIVTIYVPERFDPEDWSRYDGELL